MWSTPKRSVVKSPCTIHPQMVVLQYYFVCYVIRGSARPTPGRKFRKLDMSHKKSIAYRDVCEMQKPWAAEAVIHQRASMVVEMPMKRHVTFIHNWVNKPINQCIDEPRNQGIGESMNQRSNESINKPTSKAKKRTIHESMNQWISEPMNACFWDSVNFWIDDSVKQGTHESMHEWFVDVSVKQCRHEVVSRIHQCVPFAPREEKITFG